MDNRRQKTPVVLDTDIGDDIDDALALALVLASPELELRGVTTTGGDAYTKAGIVCQFLENVGRRDVQVAAGGTRPQQPEVKGQHQYGLRARQTNPVNKTAVDFLREQIEKSPGELTILAIGPLTNVAALVEGAPGIGPPGQATGNHGRGDPHRLQRPPTSGAGMERALGRGGCPRGVGLGHPDHARAAGRNGRVASGWRTIDEAAPQRLAVGPPGASPL